MILRIITMLIFVQILNADNPTVTDSNEREDAPDSVSIEDKDDQPTKDIGKDEQTTTKSPAEDDQTTSEAPAIDNTEEADVSDAETSESPIPELDSEEATIAVDDVTEKHIVSEDTNVTTNQEETTINLESEETIEAIMNFRANDESTTEKNFKITIDVDDAQNSAPLDLFKINREDLRRNKKDIWQWDYWCQLQPKTGEGCTQRNMRYYYDAQVDQCQQFIYTGCKGNKNNFKTIVECDRHCKGATFMTLKEAERKPPCELQPSAGLCLAMIPKYYYDVNEKTCKSFMYGGCGGNDNRFDHVQQCLQTCQGH